MSEDKDRDRFAELSDKAERGELTPGDLQAELNAYASAVEAEFKIRTEANPEDTEEYARDFFKRNIHSAAAQIVWLANNSTADSVRLSASKYVVEQALRDTRSDGDPIKKLLADLTKNDSKPENANVTGTTE